MSREIYRMIFTGDNFLATPAAIRMAVRALNAGQTYSFEVMPERSPSAHSHFFASVHGGYKTLPEEISGRWDHVDHFRKWLLIRAGWYDERQYVLDSPRDAKILARMISSTEPYLEIEIHNATVIVRRARSMAYGKMTPDEFKRCKRDTLDLLNSMLGLKAGEIEKSVGRLPS